MKLVTLNTSRNLPNKDKDANSVLDTSDPFLQIRDSHLNEVFRSETQDNTLDPIFVVQMYVDDDEVTKTIFYSVFDWRLIKHEIFNRWVWFLNWRFTCLKRETTIHSILTRVLEASWFLQQDSLELTPLLILVEVYLLLANSLPNLNKIFWENKISCNITGF